MEIHGRDEGISQSGLARKVFGGCLQTLMLPLVIRDKKLQGDS